MSIKVYDPSLNAFVQVDSGNVSQSALLLNILIELQVLTMYKQNENLGVLMDDPATLRNDIVNNPSSILGA